MILTMRAIHKYLVYQWPHVHPEGIRHSKVTKISVIALALNNGLRRVLLGGCQSSLKTLPWRNLLMKG